MGEQIDDGLEEGEGIHYPINRDVTDEYDTLTVEEERRLDGSLRERGLLVPIVIWCHPGSPHPKIVDGKNRYFLGCKIPGFVFRYRDITKRCPTEEKMRAYVRALNEHRRSRTKPLTHEEKAARVRAALKSNPDQSNRAIARQTDTSHPMVAKERAGMEKLDDVETFPVPPKALVRKKFSGGKSGKSVGIGKKGAVKLGQLGAAVKAELSDPLLADALINAPNRLDRTAIVTGWGNLPIEQQRFVTAVARRQKCDVELGKVAGRLPPAAETKNVGTLVLTADAPRASTPSQPAAAAHHQAEQQHLPLVVSSPHELLKIVETVSRRYPGDREVQWLCSWAGVRVIQEQG